MMKNNNKPWQVTAVLALCASAGSVAVQAGGRDDPYASSNRSPFVQIYGLPAAQSARLSAAGSVTTGLHIDLASNFTEHSRANESVFIDGESLRTTVQLRYGWSETVELGLDIPYLSHDGGSLDSFIDDWHDFWNLPDGDRPQFPRDQLRFRYQRNGEVLADVTRSNDGLADISVSMGYRLSDTQQRQWAVRTALKLPTGDAGSLRGSESTDLSLALHVSDQGLLQDYNVSLHGSAGVLWMDGGEVLNDLREDWVFYGSSTLSWSATPSISLKLQLDAHSAFYDSGLTELGSDSAQLIIGGAIRVSEQWTLDLAVSEDIAVDTAPDVVFHIGLKAVQW